MISQSTIPIKSACDALCISRSCYYDSKQFSTVQALDKQDNAMIQDIVLDFPRYGYRRVTKEMHRRNRIVNAKRVLRLMHEENLLCKKKRYKIRTTDSEHNLPVYKNLVKGLVVTQPNKLWVSDITYILLVKEHVYLAVIIDLFSRKCIGWALSRNIDTLLVLDALDMAVSARLHIGFDGLTHHSDQGVQYASHDYVNRLKQLGIKISMSRKGNPYDNAFAESFMKTLKAEEVYLNEYESLEDAKAHIDNFIGRVYNKKRLHSSIGYLPPEEFEEKFINTTLS